MSDESTGPDEGSHTPDPGDDASGPEPEAASDSRSSEPDTDGGRSERPTEAAENPAVGEAADDRGRSSDVPAAESGSTFDFRTTVIARTVVRLVVPLVLVTAVALLLQGHNRPGGGFIGATLTATAIALVYVVFGLEFLQLTLFGNASEANAGGGANHGAIGRYRTLFGVGLALAVGSGLAPTLFGFPFLTQGVLFLEHLPIYGELEVASALAFDVGVYFTVVGAVLTVVAEVGTE